MIKGYRRNLNKARKNREKLKAAKAAKEGKAVKEGKATKEDKAAKKGKAVKKGKAAKEGQIVKATGKQSVESQAHSSKKSKKCRLADDE